MNIFEKAAIKKFRFATTKGNLTTEQLFDLPLTSTTGAVCLDGIARQLYGEIQTLSAGSFVKTGRADPKEAHLRDLLDTVVVVIGIKQAENENRNEQAKRAAERDQLMALLEAKKTEKLATMSEAEIMARLGELQK